MSQIESCHALEILDSRGNPTLEVFVKTTDGFQGKAAVPSGASTGEREAIELRDGDPKRYGGKGVLRAVANANGPIAEAPAGMDASQQEAIDGKMLPVGGTDNRPRLVAMPLRAVSRAPGGAAAAAAGEPL